MDGANGMDIDGRNIRVAFASEKPQGSIPSPFHWPFHCFFVVVGNFV
jgi:hypothetical protein